MLCFYFFIAAFFHSSLLSSLRFLHPYIPDFPPFPSTFLPFSPNSCHYLFSLFPTPPACIFLFLCPCLLLFLPAFSPSFSTCIHSLISSTPFLPSFHPVFIPIFLSFSMSSVYASLPASFYPSLHSPPLLFPPYVLCFPSSVLMFPLFLPLFRFTGTPFHLLLSLLAFSPLFFPSPIP